MGPPCQDWSDETFKEYASRMEHLMKKIDNSYNTLQERGKLWTIFPDVSLHSTRPSVRAYATMTAVFEVMFRTFYYTVEAWECSHFILHLGDNHIPKLPHFAIRHSTRVKDWRGLVIAVIKWIQPMFAVSTLHDSSKCLDTVTKETNTQADCKSGR